VCSLGWIYTHYVYVMKTFVIPYVVQVSFASVSRLF